MTQDSWHILSFDLFCISGMCEDDAFLKQTELAISGNRKGRNFRKTEGSGSHNLFDPFCMLRPRVKGDRRRVHVYFHWIKHFHWFPAIFQSDISIKNAIPPSCLRLVLRVLQVTLSADWSGKSPRVWSRDLWRHAMKLSSFDSTGRSAKKTKEPREADKRR